VASNGLPWFRVYSELLDDKKIKRIVRSTNINKATVIGTWICLLALASESGERGRLTISEDIPYKLDDLEDETGLDHEMLMTILNQFIRMGMIVTGGVDQAYEITNWNRRQFKSDSSAERVREFRNKQDETLQKRYSNALDTDTDTDTESDTDKELTTTTAASAKNNAFAVYQSEIGPITSHISERLKVDIDDFSEPWVIDAIKIASGANARNMKYIEAILSRWKTTGKDDGTKPKREYQGKKSPESIEEHNKKVIEELVHEYSQKRN
jgi:DnaD/phage-associated family protein